MALIEVTKLTKRYAAREVLRGIDVHVEEGEILGVLGPNGSGKTTTVECIGGLRAPDSGQISVAGMDPTLDPPQLREVLGIQPQQCQLQPKLRVREALELYAAFYADPRPAAELLDRFGLTAHANQPFGKLSGGQQQRLSVALALVGNPRIAILDELTTGLDPGARRGIWDYLKGLRDDGVTMILVTHFIDEAQQLCDRVVILDDGRVIASGDPHEIAASAGRELTSFDADDAVDIEMLRTLDGVTDVTARDGRVVVSGGPDSPQAVIAALAARGFTAKRLRVESPNLDDAYLSLTDDKDKS